jgi:ATPase involved in DNA repair
MITLQSIEIEGFGSVIIPIKYKINRPGLNIISGANGSGKTTITNALAWVGWGQLVKPRKSSIIPWPHVIDENYHGTRVLLKFHDEKTKYQIIRCSDYKSKILGKAGGNRLIILENGKELKGDGLRNKADYQKWIINKLGYSFDLFKSTVLFTQELDNLMKEDGPSRKRIFDEAFETVFVNNAKKRVEERLEKSEEYLNKLSYKIGMGWEKSRGLKQLISSKVEMIQGFEKIKKKRIKEINEEIKSIRQDILGKEIQLGLSRDKVEDCKVIEMRLKDFDKCKEEEFRTDMRINGLGEEISQIKNEIDTLKKRYISPTKVCMTCNQKIPKEEIIKQKDKIKKEIKRLDNKRKTKQTDLGILSDNYEGIKKKLEEYTKVEGELKKLKTSFPSLESLISQIAIYKQTLKEKKKVRENLRNEKPLNNPIEGLRNDLAQIEEKLDKDIAESKTIGKEIEIDKWLIKDPLSNSGLKAFIFDSMLGKVNNYLKAYKDIIGFGIKVFIDMAAANKDIRILIERKGDEVPYEDLSKGQKQLVHVVLAFSLSDTVQSIKPINAIFLDELFESLAVDNIEKVGKIIQSKSKNKSIHLITHQTAFSPTNCNITYVELTNKGQTHLC